MTKITKPNNGSLISKELVDGLKQTKIRKRLSKKSVQRQWEQLPPEFMKEIRQLLNIQIEPTLAHIKSSSKKQKSRKQLTSIVRGMNKEVKETLVPVGFKANNFNLDHLLENISRLRKQIDDSNSQVVELETSLEKEMQSYKQNKEYLDKLELNLQNDLKNFASFESKLMKPLKDSGTKSRDKVFKFSDDTLADSYDKINLVRDSTKEYDAKDDRKLNKVLARLDSTLNKLNENVVDLKELSEKVKVVSKLL